MRLHGDDHAPSLTNPRHTAAGPLATVVDENSCPLPSGVAAGAGAGAGGSTAATTHSLPQSQLQQHPRIVVVRVNPRSQLPPPAATRPAVEDGRKKRCA
jgi:hypothetical protein